ncbi:MAG TPA: hypothetical protein PLM07_13430 [Candidatus Rifleibacterium sp.]|nr:hypothetical protein [Candidatus Rifleibacterium sp.]
MNSVTSSPTSFDKLKSVFFLGLTCNLTTFIGCVAVWITLARNGWVEGLINTVLAVLAYLPIFMGDAINNYTLARIRLEYQKGWDDVQISIRGREKIARFYPVYRVISIIPAYLLAAIFVYSNSSDTALLMNLKIAFALTTALNFARASYLLQKFIAPRLPSFGGKPLAVRLIITTATLGTWFIWYLNQPSGPASWLTIFSAGMLYFLIAGIMHPLPTRFSLLRPGRPASKQAFFRVELLSDEQLQAIPGGHIFTDSLKKPLQDSSFSFLGNIRMPLIELPLFQAWGVAMLSNDGRALGLLLDTEVKKGPYRSLISSGNGRFVITTDFGSGQAKFPASISYKLVERGLQTADMLKLHRAHTSDSFDQLNNCAWPRLEELVKTILRFLESETAERKRATQAVTEPISESISATSKPATADPVRSIPHDGAQP